MGSTYTFFKQVFCKNYGDRQEKEERNDEDYEMSHQGESESESKLVPNYEEYEITHQVESESESELESELELKRNESEDEHEMLM